jgi:hypothetical protein
VQFGIPKEKFHDKALMIGWEWGYIEFRVQISRNALNTPQMHHILNGIGFDPHAMAASPPDKKTNAKQMLCRMHRILIVGGSRINTRFRWPFFRERGFWRGIQSLWNYTTIVAHLRFNPKGDDCTCWHDTLP